MLFVLVVIFTRTVLPEMLKHLILNQWKYKHTHCCQFLEIQNLISFDSKKIRFRTLFHNPLKWKAEGEFNYS